MLDRPRMLLGKGHRIIQGITRNTSLHRREEHLQERRDNRALAFLDGAGADLAGQHLHIMQMGGATGGQALTHGVEIIQQLQALAVARQDERHGLVILVQGDGADPIGIQRTGAVVLAAASAKVLAVTHDARTDRTVGTADFPAGIADHGALQVAPEPTLALLLRPLGAGRQQAFDKPETGAQRLGHVGVGRGDANQQGNHVPDRTTGAAKPLGNPHGKQPGLGDLRHGLIRQLAVTLTLRSAGSNLRQDAVGAGVQFGHRYNRRRGYSRQLAHGTSLIQV